MKSCSLPTVALFSTILTLGGLLALPSPAIADSPTALVEPTLVPITATGCPRTPTPGQVSCLAEALPASDVDVSRSARPAISTETVAPMAPRNKTDSYTPSDLASLYRIPANIAPTATIGVIDVGSDPNTQAQMSYYRSYFHLPACTTANGCFREVAQDGSSRLPATDTDWVTEIAIDVQAVTAICPTCHILLVDANSAGVTDMAKATLTATKLGATYLSLSYGSPESASSTSLRNAYYSNPNVTYVAAAGDSGYNGGALFPASATNVVAVGGTSVRLVNGVWQQSAWAGAGSGCSSLQSISAPQAGRMLTSVCRGKRAVSDLSALADPETGMLFYRGGTWWNAGGTSLAAPIITALYALAGNHTSPMSVYNAADQLVDVTTGSTGSCTPAALCSAGPGWDGPTGLGTPAGLAALAADGTTVPTYSTPTAGSLTGGGGYPVRLSYHLGDTVTGAAVGSVPVFLERRRANGSYAVIRSARTDRNGNVVLADAPTSATAYRISFAGNGDEGPSVSNPVTVSRFLPKVVVRQRHGTLSATVRAPWGGVARSVPVRLQQRRGSWWVSVRRARTSTHGTVTLPLRRGTVYRLRYGGAGWQTGYTRPLRAR